MVGAELRAAIGGLTGKEIPQGGNGIPPKGYAKEALLDYIKGQLIEERGCEEAGVGEVEKLELLFARLERIYQTDLRFVPGEDAFWQNMAEEEIIVDVGMDPGDGYYKGKSKCPEGLPPYLASLYDVPLLTWEGEQVLFKKLNYLKFRAKGLRDCLSFDAPEAFLHQVAAIEGLIVGVEKTRDDICKANLRLVVSIARKFAHDKGALYELVSEGNIALLRAIEGFDYSREFRFSTYATSAIKRSLWGDRRKELKRDQRERTNAPWPNNGGTSGQESNIPDLEDPLSLSKYQLALWERQRAVLARLLEVLDPRERRVIDARFFGEGSKPMTFEELGKEFGVSKERVRQLQTRALVKLKEAMVKAGISWDVLVGPDASFENCDLTI